MKKRFAYERSIAVCVKGIGRFREAATKDSVARSRYLLSQTARGIS